MGMSAMPEPLEREPLGDPADLQRGPVYNDIRDDYDDEFTATPRSIAQRRVFVPAIAIIVIGILGILGMLGVGVGVVIDSNASRVGNYLALAIFLWMVALGAILFGFVIAGGSSLMRLRRYGLAVFAAYVVTGLSIAGCYALLFYPFGIWALILLHRPEIRQEFRRLSSTVED
jgi:hypothetical protein